MRCPGREGVAVVEKRAVHVRTGSDEIDVLPIRRESRDLAAVIDRADGHDVGKRSWVVPTGSRAIIAGSSDDRYALPPRVIDHLFVRNLVLDRQDAEAH